MKRRNDLYITEYMLQAALESKTRRKKPLVKLWGLVAAALVLMAFAIFIFASNGLI